MRPQREGMPARPTHGLLLIFPGGWGEEQAPNPHDEQPACFFTWRGGGPQALPRPRADTGMELGRCGPYTHSLAYRG